MSRLIVRLEDASVGQIVGQQWNIRDFPKPTPPDTRPTEIATERMLWKHNGALCAAKGKPYFIADLPMLITEKDWMAEHST